MSSPVYKSKHVISSDARSLISSRYKRITRAFNYEFWGTSSDTDHSLYVGSYGRNTAINTSDLDVMVILPEHEYDHFSSIKGNGPSKLLQAVRNALLVTYPNTSIHGDGQVVVVNFTDGMKFEILPAFQHMVGYGLYRYWDGTYIYPDSNMGGNWLSTNPKAEQDTIAEKNALSNGLLVDTCKHIRYVRDTEYSSYHLSGILVDAFVYEAIGGWHFRKNDEQHIDSGVSYEQTLINRYNDLSYGRLLDPTLRAPGSNMQIDPKHGWNVLGKVLDFMV
jgi:hypothetical protein